MSLKEPMPYKQRIIVCARRTDRERIEYCVIRDDGTILKCAPMPWHKLKMEDQTTPKTLEDAARIRYSAQRTQLRDRMDDLRLLTTDGKDKDPDRMQQHCARLGITF